MKLAVFILIVAVGAFAQTPDNANAGNEAYSRCLAPARFSEAKYTLCKDYLSKYPDDSSQHREAAEKFVRAYDRVSSYAKALQAFALAQKNIWFVYDPDLKIDLPNLDQKQGSYSIKIERSFKNSAEAAMLRKAEAVYGPQFNYIGQMMQSPLSWADDLSDEIVPLWGVPDNDNVVLCEVITTSAVRYYYDLSISAREHRTFRTVFPMVNTGLKYTASIKHYDEWEHLVFKYHDVNVADLNLEWSSSCGGLCGIGFTRNKLVVLDNKGEVLEMFIDADVNRGMWVS